LNRRNSRDPCQSETYADFTVHSGGAGVRWPRPPLPVMAHLVCFTNCYLSQEDGQLLRKDLWIDAESGRILDAQVFIYPFTSTAVQPTSPAHKPLQKTFYNSRKRPTHTLDLGGNILRYSEPIRPRVEHFLIPLNSPGFLDIQINGAYGFDFSIYGDDQRYIDGLRMVSSRIVETGVTRSV
jgi:N-acetylglucosamine-6-phosphate deacetylase